MRNNVKLHVTPCSRMFTHFPQSYQNSLAILLSVMVFFNTTGIVDTYKYCIALTQMLLTIISDHM